MYMGCVGSGANFTAAFYIIKDPLLFTAPAGLGPNCHRCQETFFHRLLCCGFTGGGGGEEEEEEEEKEEFQKYYFINLPNFSDVSLSGNCWPLRFNIFRETKFGKMLTRKEKIKFS